MEQNICYIHEYAPENVHIPHGEILRYMSCSDNAGDIAGLIDEFLPQLTKIIKYKASFIYLPAKIYNSSVCLSECSINSASLSKNMDGCEGGIVFSLSCGSDVDRLIEKYGHIRPSAALCINASATAAIESFADTLCAELGEIFKKDNMYLRPRFSPGYGDLSLEYQPLFLRLTNASKLCGITLTDKYMMMPSKSITAIAGVSKKMLPCSPKGCELCKKTDCKYKRA